MRVPYGIVLFKIIKLRHWLLKVYKLTKRTVVSYALTQNAIISILISEYNNFSHSITCTFSLN